MNNPQTTLGLTDNAIQHLHTLLQINMDCRDGFRHAAELTSSSALKQIAVSAADRHDQQQQLLMTILQLDSVQSEAAAVVSAIHRVWVGLKTESRHSKHVLLEELLRMQAFIKDHYTVALVEIRGRAIRQMLSEQLKATGSVEDRLRKLRS